MAFTGQVLKLPIGQDGLSGIENIELMAPDQLQDALNISFAHGGITKDGGSAKLNASAIGAPSMVIGVHDWWPDTSNQRTIALTANGSAFRDTGAGTFGTTLRSGQAWNTASVPVFVESGKEAAASNKKLYIFTGASQVQVLSGDGVTIADIGANMPVDWAANFPTCGANHLNRLWGAGNPNDPHRLYYSTVTDTEDFTSAGSGTVALFPGEGTKIVAMSSFYGLLLVWKFPRGLFAIDTTDASSANWIVRRVSSSIGGASPRCWCPIDDQTGTKVLFMAPDGNFHTIQTTDTYGSVALQTISERVYFTRWAEDNLNLGGFTRTRAVFYPLRREAHFSVQSTGSSTFNRRIIWDFNRLAADGRIVARLRYNDFPNGPALFTYTDSSNIVRIGSGDDLGFIHQLDQEAKSNAGSNYTSRFKSAAIDLDELELATRRKVGKFLELVLLPKGAFTLTVRVYWDDELKYTQDYSMGGTGVGLGSFVLGTHALAGGSVRREKHRLTGDGFRFAIEAENAVAGEDYSVSRFYLHYGLGSDRVDID